MWDVRVLHPSMERNLRKQFPFFPKKPTVHESLHLGNRMDNPSDFSASVVRVVGATVECILDDIADYERLKKKTGWREEPVKRADIIPLR